MKDRCSGKEEDKSVRSGGCEFLPLTRDPVACDAAGDLYTEVFTRDEPMTRTHAIDPEYFRHFARIYARLCGEWGMSSIARDGTTGDLAGFLFCSDLAVNLADAGPDISVLLEQFPESVAIIDALEQGCPEISSPRPGTILHVFQIGVSPEHRCRGIARDLIGCSIRTAKEHGFSKIAADCTSAVSRHAFASLGFREAGYIPYDSFIVNGRAFFKGIPDGLSLMLRDL